MNKIARIFCLIILATKVLVLDKALASPSFEVEGLSAAGNIAEYRLTFSEPVVLNSEKTVIATEYFGKWRHDSAYRPVEAKFWQTSPTTIVLEHSVNSVDEITVYLDFPAGFVSDGAGNSNKKKTYEVLFDKTAPWWLLDLNYYIINGYQGRLHPYDSINLYLDEPFSRESDAPGWNEFFELSYADGRKESIPFLTDELSMGVELYLSAPDELDKGRKVRLTSKRVQDRAGNLSEPLDLTFLVESDFSYASDCLAPSSVGKVGAVGTVCEGMLIVDRDMLLNARDNGAIDGGVDYKIDAYDVEWTFGDSERNLYVGQVTDFGMLLFFKKNFNADIGYWDVSRGTTFRYMFYANQAFNQDISGWNVSSSKSLSAMFEGATSFNQDLSSWDVSSVRDFSGAFLNSGFNQDISGWNASNGREFNGMFKGSAFAQDISAWDVSSASSFREFRSDHMQPSDMPKFDDVAPVVTVSHAQSYFGGDNEIYESDTYRFQIDYSERPYKPVLPEGLDVVGGTVERVHDRWSKTHYVTVRPNPGATQIEFRVKARAIFDAYGNENAASNTFVLPLNPATTSADKEYATNCLAPASVGKVGASGTDCQDMLIVNRQMLLSAVEDKTYAIKRFGETWTFADSDRNVYTGQVTNFSNLFSSRLDADNTFNQDIGYWDVSGAEAMNAMFRSQREFNQDLSNWDVSNVTTMRQMFDGAHQFNGDISTWDVRAVTDMSRTFIYAHSFDQDLSGWDVSSVTNMGYMFYDARAFNQDISAWDVSAVTDMYQMFYAAGSFDQDLAAWTVGRVDNFRDFSNNSAWATERRPRFGYPALTVSPAAGQSDVDASTRITIDSTRPLKLADGNSYLSRVSLKLFSSD